MQDVNAQALERFYAAFKARDGDTMAASYAPGATFTDPVFTDLSGEEPGAMWRMLTGQAKDLGLELLESSVDGDHGQARWRATYSFSQTGRRVVNVVSSTFTFRNGLITAQRDDFDFYRWSRQALGPMGWALGWTPIVHRAVRRSARASLDRFMGAGH